MISRSWRRGAKQVHRESGMDANERRQLRKLLQGAGLKVSLVRLKILDVLQRSERARVEVVWGV